MDPCPKHPNSGAFITPTSAFSFNSKECRGERRRAWHFIERHNTQVSWRSIKFAPSQNSPLQCEAVTCCVLFSLYFFSSQKGSFSNSNWGRCLNCQVQSQWEVWVYVAQWTGPFLWHHYQFKTQPWSGSSGHILRVLHWNRQGSCDR